MFRAAIQLHDIFFFGMHGPRPGERTEGSVGLLPTKNLRCPQSTYAGATRITSYLTPVDPGGAGPQPCGVADPSRRGGVILSPPTRKKNLAMRGARGTLRAATSGPYVDGATDFPKSAAIQLLVQQSIVHPLLETCRNFSHKFSKKKKYFATSCMYM